MNWRRLIHCAGGLRCANIIAPELPPGLPPGAEIVLEYTCRDCGTHYHWDSTTRTKKRIDKLSESEREGVTIAPGATHEFVFMVPDEMFPDDRRRN